MNRKVLIIDDEPRYRDLYARALSSLELDVDQANSAEEAFALLRKEAPALVISDVRMPGESGIELLSRARKLYPSLPFLLITAYANVRDAVSALKLGAVDYLAKPVNLDEFFICVRDTVGVLEGGEPAMDDPPRELLEGVVAESAAMKEVLREAWCIARADVNVLLMGESGTGKEVMARFIHRCGARSGGPMVAVNCAALPDSLLNSELFGHEKGAFTGADRARMGKFREADGGVLFLDEIGDMPLELQPVLLRAVEQRSFTPVGATGEVSVDFRLIAATNKALEEEVDAGGFRADLFYRLGAFCIELPPLRERPEDILPLARFFLSRAGSEPKRLARSTSKLMLEYAWPGNIRELENAMVRAHLLTRTDVVMPESLPAKLRKSSREDGADEEEGISTLREAEIASIKRALEQTEGNRTHAAKLLGITRRGLLKKLNRFGIS